MNEKMLTFIPKIFFPGSVFLGKQSFIALNTMESSKKIVVASGQFVNKNKKLTKELTHGLKIIRHSGEPTDQDVEKIKKKCKDYEVIIAIGGGSIIDLVKVVKKDLGKKMIAVSTTIGSGAEVSRFSLITDSIKNKKNVIASSLLLPEVIICNPQLYISLEKQEIIFQCIDAFSHAIESLVSKFSNPISDLFSIIALDSLYESLGSIKKTGITDEMLEKMKIASLFAGFAQSSAATGLLHSFAHEVGARENISHAKVISTFFIDVIQLNIHHTNNYKKLNKSKYFTYDNFIPKTKKLFNLLKIKPDKKISIDKNLAESIRLNISTLSNPYSPTTEDINKILRKIIKT